jgi:hypothetical protein
MVKARLTNVRIRVCSGGSIPTSAGVRIIRANSSPMFVGLNIRPCRFSVLEENTAGSFSTACTSSWRLMAKALSCSTKCTGARSRSTA